MRDRFLCLVLGLLLGLLPSALGCCSQDVRRAAEHEREGAAKLRAAAGELRLAWLAFRAASEPAEDLGEQDRAAWREVADEVAEAIDSVAASAAALEEAAAAIGEHAGEPESEGGR